MQVAYPFCPYLDFECKIGEESGKKAKLYDIPQKKLSSLLCCLTYRRPEMNMCAVHLATLAGFIWSFAMLEISLMKTM